MATFCGGFHFDETLKLENGIITTAAGTVDASNVVTACAQLFDGAVFKVVDKTITSVDADEVNDVVSVCGANFDATYFSVVDGKLKYTASVDVSEVSEEETVEDETEQTEE